VAKAPLRCAPVRGVGLAPPRGDGKFTRLEGSRKNLSPEDEIVLSPYFAIAPIGTGCPGGRGPTPRTELGAAVVPS